MLAGRILTGLAALTMLAVLVLGLAPNPGSSDTGPAHVDCGTPFVDTGWSGEEGCDTQFGMRLVVMCVLWSVALPLGIAGLVLLHREVRYT